MTKWMASILVLVSGGLGTTIVVQRSQLRETRRDVDQMRGRLERLESRQKEAAVARAAVEQLQEQVARVEKKAAEAPPPAPAISPDARPGALPLAVTEDDIQKIVEAKVEEKLQAQGAKAQKNGGGDDRKMPLHDMAKELTLDPATQAQVAEIANGAKKEIFELLKLPRADGTNVADDLIKIFTSGDTSGAQQLFAKLFTEKVPGTDTTYVAAVGAIQEKSNQGLQKVMGGETFTRFKHMGVHPENIQTGFDPWAEYLKTKQ